MEVVQAASEIRRQIIEAAWRTKCAHVGSCLSCVDILTALYFEVMRLEPWAARDLFILSKAHAALALYCTLAQRGIIDRKVLAGYFQNGGLLPGHLDRFSAPGIEVSAGSLGHGFNLGLGQAFGLRRQHSNRRVYVVIGDGETQEGSIWEGAMFAAHQGLANFTAIMDYNNLQGYGRPDEICAFEPLSAKWEAFGWETLSVDGHDIRALSEILNRPTSGKPRMILARTTKGKGVSFMEDQLIWHYYVVTDQHKQAALQELAA